MKKPTTSLTRHRRSARTLLVNHYRSHAQHLYFSLWQHLDYHAVTVIEAHLATLNTFVTSGSKDRYAPSIRAAATAALAIVEHLIPAARFAESSATLRHLQRLHRCLSYFLSETNIILNRPLTIAAAQQ